MRPIIRKGMQDIKTMTFLQMFRARTSTGALAELTSLSGVKERLKAEIQKLDSRYDTLKELIKKVEEKERILYKFVDKPKGLKGQKTHERGSLEKKVEQKNSGIFLNEVTLKY